MDISKNIGATVADKKGADTMQKPLETHDTEVAEVMSEIAEEYFPGVRFVGEGN